MKETTIADTTKYKFRAECEQDVIEFFSILNPCGVEVFEWEVKEIRIFPDAQSPEGHLVPDKWVTFKTASSLDRLRSVVRRVPDGHVMLESLNYENEYTGQRYFHG